MTLDPIQTLRDEFSHRSAKNESYSLRSFARKLKVSPGLLCNILNRKRNLTPNLAQRLSQEIGFSYSKRQRFVKAVKNRSRSKGSLPFENLAGDQFELISAWYHYGILSLFKCSTYEGDLNHEQIAKTLGITRLEARDAIERLLQMGLIRVKDGNLCYVADGMTANSEVSSSAIQQYHRQMLNLAITVLSPKTMDKRDFSSVTMPIDRNKLPKAREMIREFRRKLCAFLEEGKTNDVFALNIQLFSILNEEET